MPKQIIVFSTVVYIAFFPLLKKLKSLFFNDLIGNNSKYLQKSQVALTSNESVLLFYE